MNKYGYILYIIMLYIIIYEQFLIFKFDFL